MVLTWIIQFLVIFIFFVFYILTQDQKLSEAFALNQNEIESEEEKALNYAYKIRLQEYERIHESENFKNTYNISLDFHYYKNFLKETIMDKAVLPNQQERKSILLQMMSKKKCKFSLLDLKRSFPIKDDPSRWFGSSYEKNISNLPLSGICERKPWSGSYWPMRNGLISVRYCWNEKNTVGKINPESSGYFEIYKFQESVQKYQQPAEHQFQKANNFSNYEKYIDAYYSPAEKYDLFIGDYSFTLTNKMKQEGYSHINKTDGDIPTWYGICHGWSPSAFIFERPKHPVNVTNPDGIKIRFFPDDIKALASLFIANANVRTNFLGDVCRVYKPEKPYSDSKTGLYLDPRCHALNPGSLIVVLANDIGKNHKNFNLDPDADPEIWNQPMNGYILRYYNPITQDFSSDPNKVKIPIKFIKGSSDKFLNFVARMAGKTSKFIVGAYINVTYTIETNPHHSVKDWEDANRTLESIAAIELDEKGNIVGGEWKYNGHPNFIWKFDEKLVLEGCCDRNIKNFAGIVTKDVTKWGISASNRKQVLKSVVDYIVNESVKNISESETPETDFSHRWDFLFDD